MTTRLDRYIANVTRPTMTEPENTVTIRDGFGREWEVTEAEYAKFTNPPERVV